jgi:hypothetical protein
LLLFLRLWACGQRSCVVEHAGRCAEPGLWLKAAQVADAAEDKAFGADMRGDEMSDWVTDKQARLARIRGAKAVLEAEAKAKAASEERQSAARFSPG